MPSLKIIRSAIAELPNGPPLVVALTGGTTGIGSYVAKALATAFAKSGSKLRVYIVGRNATRAETVITDGQRISPGSEWRFIQATDLALISDVDRASAEIIRQETEGSFHGGPPRLDLLYMSHCYPILKERSTTTEGLDSFLSTTYYSRMRFILQLMPILLASPLPAHVISIYAGGMEDGTSPGESPIGCPSDSTYGISGVRKHTCFMKNFFFEELAEKHAGKLSLSHIYPGLVDGPTFYSPDMPTWFKAVWTLIKPLAWLYMTAPAVCGEVMVSLATPRYPAKGGLVNGVEVAKNTKGELGGGSYALGQRGDSWSKGKSYAKVRTGETNKQVWDHTMETLDRIEKENADHKP
ncbi:uncharacterized protein BDZ99DRAFT_474848 [Mytilinidion resinicola]|uniref:NAD(P)-binding protein n=1 Tax=Mytilinidion resinicola TaxID=574789 RepID=A0A6A6YVB4_9PEZI|nr:uncharacterized protein BDZ99DRAFT_474848 [Mytilinidion resinicola]KAF2812731.1 hypothetical protein BDZ99DRAFT_474848 [Mytilinidion resinicola]